MPRGYASPAKPLLICCETIIVTNLLPVFSEPVSQYQVLGLVYVMLWLYFYDDVIIYKDGDACWYFFALNFCFASLVLLHWIFSHNGINY